MSNLDLGSLQMLLDYIRDPNYARISRKLGVSRQATTQKIKRLLVRFFGDSHYNRDNIDAYVLCYREELMDALRSQIAAASGSIGGKSKGNKKEGSIHG